MSGAAGAIAGDGPGRAILAFIEERGATPDAPQRLALDRLAQLADALAAFRAARQSTLKRLFAPPDVPRGVYLWGAVGRGKSMLMDAFYAAVPLRRKTRVHFHAFMRDVHAELATLTQEEDPLATVAARIARRWRLICFDEFHVSDVADAMILGRLLTHLFTAGVVFVMTSNYRPDDLWPGGLNRERFLPTIALLREWLDVVEVNGDIDYRLRMLEQVESYYSPIDAATDAHLAAWFDRLATGPDESAKLSIDGRPLLARRRAGNAVWFDFATLCDGPRSQRDYLELARRFAIVFVSGVPRMGPATADQARRFTWLVDILYDHRVKLIVSAAVPVEALYVDGRNALEFSRTVSRLIEMRSRDYMAEAPIRTAMEAPAVETAAATTG
jgi:cell division protein ZapE